jgi:hypothetical protein
MSGQPKTLPPGPVRRSATPVLEFEIVRHPNGRMASLRVLVGRSFGALVLSLLALWRGNDLAAVLKGLIHW